MDLSISDSWLSPPEGMTHAGATLLTIASMNSQNQTKGLPGHGAEISFFEFSFRRFRNLNAAVEMPCRPLPAHCPLPPGPFVDLGREKN